MLAEIAAPAIPAAAEALVALVPLLLGLVLLGMHKSIQAWLLPLVNAFAHPHGSIFKRIALKPLSLAAGPARGIIVKVDSAISHAAAANLRTATRLFHGSAHILEWSWREMLAWEEATISAFAHLRHDTVPRLIHEATHVIEREAHAARVLGARAWAGTIAVEHRLGRDIDRLSGRLEAAAVHPLHRLGLFTHGVLAPRVRATEHSISVTIPHRLEGIGKRIGGLEREAVRDTGRLSRLEKAVLGGALLGTVVRYLARRLPWLFCRRVDQFARGLCGASPSAIDALLATLLTALTIAELRTLVKEAAAIEHTVTEDLRKLLKAYPPPV